MDPEEASRVGFSQPRLGLRGPLSFTTSKAHPVNPVGSPVTPDNMKSSQTRDLIPDNTVAVYATRKYKPVERRVKPVATTTPESAKIGRRFPSDPLEFLPVLPHTPPPFSPGSRLTQERYDELNLNKHDFLTP
ncbi:hypothetical protein CALCODRAFT_54558 [Calocera cornea HHB12733]|uniref:Uncharacterized protein n=1 Tax=Calocera cornea HHB12733 TaxID=1353952 RepID=A0A165DQR2_9BASI|nr:hypothetical protein CALCODRAFT_54558 [Calocera cornea HHB12733]